jgi:hypothetical protein
MTAFIHYVALEDGNSPVHLPKVVMSTKATKILGGLSVFENLQEKGFIEQCDVQIL